MLPSSMTMIHTWFITWFRISCFIILYLPCDILPYDHLPPVLSKNPQAHCTGDGMPKLWENMRRFHLGIATKMKVKVKPPDLSSVSSLKDHHFGAHKVLLVSKMCFHETLFPTNYGSSGKKLFRTKQNAFIGTQYNTSFLDKFVFFSTEPWLLEGFWAQNQGGAFHCSTKKHGLLLTHPKLWFGNNVQKTLIKWSPSNGS